MVGVYHRQEIHYYPRVPYREMGLAFLCYTTIPLTEGVCAPQGTKDRSKRCNADAYREAVSKVSVVHLHACIK